MIVYCIFCGEGGGEMVCEKCVTTHPSSQECTQDGCEICSLRDCPFEDLTHYEKDGCMACTEDAQGPKLCRAKHHSGWKRPVAKCPDPECVAAVVMTS